MPCLACTAAPPIQNSLTARVCAFEGEFSDNWNCAKLNQLRDLVEDREDSRIHRCYCAIGDQSYTTIDVSAVEDLDMGAYCLWLTWYKSRGRTEQVWLLFDSQPPRRPTYDELCLILSEFPQ